MPPMEESEIPVRGVATQLFEVRQGEVGVVADPAVQHLAHCNAIAFLDASFAHRSGRAEMSWARSVAADREDHHVVFV